MNGIVKPYVRQDSVNRTLYKCQGTYGNVLCLHSIREWEILGMAQMTNKKKHTHKIVPRIRNNKATTLRWHNRKSLPHFHLVRCRHFMWTCWFDATRWLNGQMDSYIRANRARKQTRKSVREWIIGATERVWTSVCVCVSQHMERVDDGLQTYQLNGHDPLADILFGGTGTEKKES